MAQSHILSVVEPDGSTGNTQRSRDPMEGDLQVQLDDRELWTRFQSLTNEMIVTKNGRYIKYHLFGLTGKFILERRKC